MDYNIVNLFFQYQFFKNPLFVPLKCDICYSYMSLTQAFYFISFPIDWFLGQQQIVAVATDIYIWFLQSRLFSLLPTPKNRTAQISVEILSQWLLYAFLLSLVTVLIENSQMNQRECCIFLVLQILSFQFSFKNMSSIFYPVF